ITSDLSSPVAITTPPDGTNRLFITEQPGVISFWNGSALAEFMDIQNIVNFGGEQGLLSTAFHPDYANNGYFYVYFTNDNGDNEVDRFSVMSGDPNQGDPSSRVIILNIPHPGQSNHNGGQIVFGPDGYLHIGTGDGGGSGDPDENGQDINEILGKILRIDVGDGTPPYTIPPDNPYANIPGRDEIWSIGMRNPWRFGFDRLTGDQFIADVGQDDWEEVDLQAFGTPGGVNWGWDDREGAHCFEPMNGCQTAGRTDPIMEYSHNLGCSVSGGYRYRGTAIPQIYGKYFFGDFCSGSVWGSSQSGNGTWSLGSSLSTGFNISGFGEDANGEMYIINLNGAVYKFTGTNSNLALTVTDNPDPVFQNTTLTYTLTVTNNGPKTANSVVLIDELPASVTFISSSNGNCVHNNGIVTCNLNNMNNGASIQFTIDVMPTALGPIDNYAIVSANENDPDATDNSDTETTQVIPLTGTELALTKSDSADPIDIGANLTYTIQVTNNGPEDATGVTVTDTLPGSVTFVSASPGCSEASGTVTCVIGNLDAGSNVSVQIDVIPTQAGAISNTATVTGNESDPFPANNSDTEDTLVTDPNACMFCDDFNDGTLDPNWTYIRNSSFWSEDGTSLIGTNTRKTTAAATVFAGCLTCYAETTMRTAGGAGNRLWLLHHFVDKRNVVEFLMKEEKDRWVLKHRVNSRVVAKQKYLMPIDPNTDYIVRIT
ncbi:PQQ-dependent sugar dehydrogenase, partial [bacterium]|nr:PQQ-dependent sugar dehydrogenase [bacterium]